MKRKRAGRSMLTQNETISYSCAYHDATADGLTGLTKLMAPFPKSL